MEFAAIGHRDAVVLDVQIAQLPVRALGALIDIVIMVLLNIFATVLWALTLRQFDLALAQALVVIFTVLVFIAYPVVFETATRGAPRASSRWDCGLRRTAAGTVPAGPVPALWPAWSRSGCCSARPPSSAAWCPPGTEASR